MNKQSMLDLFKKIATEMTSQGEKIFQKVADKLNDESMTHKEVMNLCNSVQRILKNYKGNVDSQVKGATEQLIEELKAILELDSELSSSKYPMEQLVLAEKSIHVIYKMIPELESNPQLWNPIKVSINSFIEKISKIESAFDREETDFAVKQEFNDYKKSIADLQSRLSESTTS